ncbi:MAG: peptide deformylase [bacterium]
MTNNQQSTINKKVQKVKIVQKEAPVLRGVARNVPIKDIKTKKIQDIIRKMQKALHAEEDGVAIAAPQIGEGLRIFVVNGFVTNQPLGHPMSKYNRTSDVQVKEKPPNDLVFINPEIVKLSRKKMEVEEGCLSVRWYYGLVKRSEKATVQAHDETGKKFEKGASGLLAQIFQHEIDHLNGVLFTDKATSIENLPPKETTKNGKK